MKDDIFEKKTICTKKLQVLLGKSNFNQYRIMVR